MKSSYNNRLSRIEKLLGVNKKKCEGIVIVLSEGETIEQRLEQEKQRGIEIKGNIFIVPAFDLNL